LGSGWKSNAEGFRTGRSAFRPVTLFDVSRQRVRQAAEVQLDKALPRTELSPRQEKRLDRAAKLLLFAARDAWDAAGWEESESLHWCSAQPAAE